MEARIRAARAEYRGLLWGVQGGKLQGHSPLRPHLTAPPPWGLALRQEQAEGPSPSRSVTRGRADGRVWDRGPLGPGLRPARPGGGASAWPVKGRWGLTLRCRGEGAQ